MSEQGIILGLCNKWQFIFKNVC